MTDQGTTDQQRAEKMAGDIFSVTTSDFNGATINSNLFSADLITSQNEELDFGIIVHQDGPELALSAGTVKDWDFSTDGPHIHTYHSLNIEQARAIASALDEAADEAERILEEAEEDEQSDGSQSFIRRLIS